MVYSIEYLTALRWGVSLSKVESQSSITDNPLRVDGVIGNILYLKSGSDTNLTLLKLSDNSGNTMCEFGGSTEVNSTGLVEWWTFDEVINQSGTLILPDMSGNGNNGTLMDANISNIDGNTTHQQVSSKLGNALEFDGIDDYIVVVFNNASSFNNSITVISFVKSFGNTNYGSPRIISSTNESFTLWQNLESISIRLSGVSRINNYCA